MAKEGPGSGQPELAAVLPLPARTEAEPLSPAGLAVLMAEDSAHLDASLAEGTAALRRALGVDV